MTFITFAQKKSIHDAVTVIICIHQNSNWEQNETRDEKHFNLILKQNNTSNDDNIKNCCYTICQIKKNNKTN